MFWIWRELFHSPHQKKKKKKKTCCFIALYISFVHTQQYSQFWMGLILELLCGYSDGAVNATCIKHGVVEDWAIQCKKKIESCYVCQRIHIRDGYSKLTGSLTLVVQQSNHVKKIVKKIMMKGKTVPQTNNKTKEKCKKKTNKQTNKQTKIIIITCLALYLKFVKTCFEK